MASDRPELLKERRACRKSEGGNKKGEESPRERWVHRLLGQPPACLSAPNVLIMTAALEVVKVQGCQATSML